jgi:deoxyribodipyrimidine photo-lyase
MGATLVWLAQDLRVTDHPALWEAVRRGGPVVPVYVWAPEEAADWPRGAASRWWLHHSLTALARDLRGLGSPLVLRRGPTAPALVRLAREVGADAVVWTRDYDPPAVRLRKDVRAALQREGLQAGECEGRLLWPPEAVLSRDGRPLQVFTPFWRACLAAAEPGPPLPVPPALPPPAAAPDSLTPADLGLLPAIPWDAGLAALWRPGEAGAARRLAEFAERVGRYPERRDRPDLEGTSRLSPHLHFGEVSPRQVWRALDAAELRQPAAGSAIAGYRRQLAWREFGHHLLHHHPHTPTQPLRPEFAAFPWQEDAEALAAWQQGRTGYPLVDAGMRELWATGWMHNRVRMVAASFLVKHLLLPWQEGARWFWDTLVDADLANNTLGWQWTAGCGADAAPYFRIFNPVLQGEKFDPDGTYVRRWVPELAALPSAVIHRPWEAGSLELAAAGVRLGDSYPHPLVDHAAARERALAALATIRARR